MAAGGMLGTVMGGGNVTGSQVGKTALGLAGGAIAGTAGKMLGSGLGGLFGDDNATSPTPSAMPSAGGESSGGSGSSFGSGNAEMVGLLQATVSLLRSIYTDGLTMRGAGGHNGKL